MGKTGIQPGELMQQRLEEYANFRHNLKMLRAYHGTRSKELAAELGLRNLKRLTELELGRIGRPQWHEIQAICRYYGVSEVDLLYKRIKIVFE